jgi:Bacterial extracellular solute-binding proteins, family 5 Middle
MALRKICVASSGGWAQQAFSKRTQAKAAPRRANRSSCAATKSVTRKAGRGFLAVLGAAACVLIGWALGGAGRLEASRRPRYGGTLRVEIGARVSSLDSAVAIKSPDEAAAKDEIETLLYDHRNADGTFGGAGDGVAGSGAFRIAEWEPGRHLTLAANEDYSAGRPFVDSIDIEMGRSPKDRLLDIELGKTDFIQIPPEEARHAAEQGIRVSTSQPDELVAVVFVAGRPAAEDARLREALSRAIDRNAMVNFILQKEGEAAGGLLPEWSSGTAFLFSTAADPGDAKELVHQIGGSPRIVLGYDLGDPLEESLAERIAVDAREAGIRVTPEALENERVPSNCDARLMRLRMPSPDPRVALASFLATLAPVIDANGTNGAEIRGLAEGASAGDVYDVERGAVNAYRVAPLVWLPEVYGLSARVRDWKAPAAGAGWPLADVWLEEESH